LKLNGIPLQPALGHGVYGGISLRFNMRHRHEHDHEEEEVLEQILIVLENIYSLLISQSQSTTATLSTKGVSMATTAIATFTDATGTTATPPAGDGSGLLVTFASDNPTVTIGVATESGDTFTAAITGTDAFNLSATVANTSGAPLVDDDGTTPFIQPSPIAVPSSTPPPAQATTAVLSVS
jgi:hypothetical protein